MFPSFYHLFCWFSLLTFVVVQCQGSLNETSPFKLTIIHNNDFHANYLPIKNNNNAECFENYDDDEHCVAGVARMIAKVEQFRKKTDNLLFLNAGDHFQGTVWYSLLKSKVVANFVKLMKHDAMTIGNHEFDDGPSELVKFINFMEGQLKIVCCNLVVNETSDLYNKIEKSTVITINGTKIAIIGYITPETSFLASPGKLVTFRNEVEAIQEEIDLLKSEHPDLQIFIGLGHSGYDRDIEIAEKISDLDLIVGGHSHTFLYSGQGPVPSNEKPQGNYPSIVEHHIKSSDLVMNKTTLVVQAYAYGKYLGWLDLLFNENGDIIEYQGEPIFLQHNSPSDSRTMELVKLISKEISPLYNKKIGIATEQFPETQSCRHQECEMGNLIADSFVDKFNSFIDDLPFSNNSCDLIALINGGNIRKSIDKGPISYGSIFSVLPFGNTLGLLMINGSELIDIFHHSADQHDRGGFLQVSGLQVKYKLKQSNKLIKTSKLIYLKARCHGEWIPVQEDQKYKVVVNNFIANCGDNYTMVDSNKWINYQLGDRELLTKYVEKMQNITPYIDGRIIINYASHQRITKFFLIILILLSFIWNI